MRYYLRRLTLRVKTVRVSSTNVSVLVRAVSPGVQAEHVGVAQTPRQGGAPSKEAGRRRRDALG